MEFHISDLSRKKYGFEKKLFAYDGNVIFADFRAVREFVFKMNKVRAEEKNPNRVSAAEMNALGLMDEIMHALIHEYSLKYNPDLNLNAWSNLLTEPGEEKLQNSVHAFSLQFPPSAVFEGTQTVNEYLNETNPKGKKNCCETLEEMLLLWVTNRNPAAMKIAGELFNETPLVNVSDYNKVIAGLDSFFQTQPKINGMTLIDFLRQPAIEHPDSIFDQLEYIRLHWLAYLGEYLRKLLLSLDLLKEEYKEHGFGGPGEVQLPGFGDAFGFGEYEAFSADSEWMPRLVLIAKNTYVWLDQLTKQYGHKISHLDQIPDEELKKLADEGFTGLWLIGLWERSKASQTIKQWCGNPEALASAYSLSGYQIAWDLGGEDAFNALKEKARRCGLRLASDMVPNHMGIDSDWVLYHPDRFLSLDYCPYPSYSFNCGNLSPDPNIGIRIEDHYFTREDCAVVFQRVDYRTGDVRYIYHGNDGTSMPWNDTAQLNYLNAEVRETVIQTILEVAKHTPIIRFDAAMTLAKKHYQRLWFPEPGSGGDIASRAEHGLTKEDFDRAFPVEFWREVVDRIAAEAPGTLLLAEAFWMMENYFVRTLGMHRVYNSAFMNLLRDEDNARYRVVMKNTLEFNPEILKRYVNFMNNPDERTAVEQFGKGDKYFGICVLMATMPGLPMFGHGQLEGYSEKYGMEYKKAYKDEGIDHDLLRRHEQEIFPLLHQRRRFAEVKNFALYNFANAYGNVDENVYAYSNYGEGRHNLVIYNNRYGDTEGFVKQSVSYMVSVNGENTHRTTTLGEQLGLHNEEGYFIVLHDHIRNMDYVRRSRGICEEGLFFKLGAYQYFVFNEIYEVRDDAKGTWERLCAWLNGEGTHNIDDALQDVLYGHILMPYRSCFDGHKLVWLHSKIGKAETEYAAWNEIRNGTWEDFKRLSDVYCATYGLPQTDEKKLFSAYTAGMAEMLKDPQKANGSAIARYARISDKAAALVKEEPVLWTLLLIAQQERLLSGKPNSAFDIHEDWHLKKHLEKLFRAANRFEISVSDQAEWTQWLFNILGDMSKWTSETLNENIETMLDREDTRRLLKVNEYDNILWFNGEAAGDFEKLVFLCGYYLKAFDEASAAEKIETAYLFEEAAEILHQRLTAAEYHYDRLFYGQEKSETDGDTAI